jgi:hypothetical protein
MNAILNGLFGPSHVLLFLEPDLHQSTGGGLPSLPGAAPSAQLDRRFPRRDVDRSRLDGEPWRPQA